MRASSVLAAAFGVASVQLAMGEVPCEDAGTWGDPSTCTCNNNAKDWDCTTDKDSGTGYCSRANKNVMQCKFRRQGGYFCHDTEKWASGKSGDPENIISGEKFTGDLATQNLKGLGQCTGRLCIDVMGSGGGPKGQTDEDCYCPCKKDVDNCCKYSWQEAGTTKYGCLHSHNRDFFKTFSKPLTVVAGYESVCNLGGGAGGAGGAGAGGAGGAGAGAAVDISKCPAKAKSNALWYKPTSAYVLADNEKASNGGHCCCLLRPWRLHPRISKLPPKQEHAQQLGGRLGVQGGVYRKLEVHSLQLQRPRSNARLQELQHLLFVRRRLDWPVGHWCQVHVLREEVAA
jgi:hypothetical protein